MNRSGLAVAVVCLVIAGWALPATAGEAVGWRTDGTGKYPAATPPTHWSPDTNVKWSTPMPKWSNATPILVDGRIFVCSEPATLVCVNADDGKILWSASTDYEDVLDAAQLKEMSRAARQIKEIRGKINPLRKELRALTKLLKKKPGDADAKAKVEPLKARIGELDKQLKPLVKLARPATHGVNGYTTSTPVGDGRVVCVVFGTGIVACFDMKGNRRWARLLEKPTAGYGHSASPLIVGDKLLVPIQKLTALDLADGKVLWQAPCGRRWGSPVHARIGQTDVVVTPGGEIVRVADGAVLASKLAKLDYCSPIVQDGVAYFIKNGGKAIRLPTEAADKIAPEVLWKTEPKKDRYYASPVVHDGLIYAVTQKKVFSVIDAASGKVVYEKTLALGRGTVYPSIALAGGLLYVSIDSGGTLVLKPGRRYEEIAANKLEAFRSSPVFAGGRMYVRAFKKLYCISE